MQKCVIVKKENGKQVIIKCDNETELSEVKKIYEGKILAEGENMQECIQQFEIWLQLHQEKIT